VAVVLTLIQTKQIINIRKLDNTKKKNTINTSIRITEIPTHAHTLQNKLKQPQYKLKQTQYEIYPNEIVTI